MRILLLERGQADASLIEENLARAPRGPFELLQVSTLCGALAVLRQQSFDLLLTSLQLPDSQGLDTLAKIHEQAGDRLPIIILTGIEDEALGVEAVRRGAQDFLPKAHLSPESLSRALRSAFELQRAKQALLTSEEQLRLQSTALSAAANSIIITDRAGTILWVNPAFCALTGFSAEEVIGRNPRFLNAGRQDAAFYRAFWQTILSGQIWRGEFINRRKDATEYINEQTVTPVRSASGEITRFIGVMQDVTDRRRAEAQVRTLNEQLEQRVRDRTAQLEVANQELEAFAYSVSHDLRAPLRHITAFAGLLDEAAGSSLPEPSRHYLDQITASAQQMRRLIDNLLALSRSSRAEMSSEPLSLQTLVAEAIAQLQPEAAGRNIRWKTHSLPDIRADRPLLRQVLINLLSNAIKYTRSRDPAEIEVGFNRQTASEIIIFVRDNGVGFDMQFGSKLFGVFQRLHPAEEFEGTGIGLANVRRIIARHGGRTWAEGKPGAGATFYFSLPNRSAAPLSESPLPVLRDADDRQPIQEPKPTP